MFTGILFLSLISGSTVAGFASLPDTCLDLSDTRLELARGFTCPLKCVSEVIYVLSSSPAPGSMVLKSSRLIAAGPLPVL